MPPTVGLDEGELSSLLTKLVGVHAIPGAVLAVYDGTRVVRVAAGVANLRSGSPMTPETVFLLGSVTKVWLTTLMMTLVESGALELDAPVRRYLPEFRLLEDQAAAALTVRHLLCHTSGIDAADFAPDDLGDGPDAAAEYVARLADKGQLHRPGAMWSYCNPGFVLAGQIIEAVTGTPFDTAMKERLFDHAGLGHTSLSVDEAILGPVAIGHFPDGAGGHVPTSRFLLPRCLGPAGSTLLTTVEDAITFGRIHLADGADPRGQQILSPVLVAEMAKRQIDLPVPALGSAGLGWLRSEHVGTLLLTHGGGSIGGLSQLAIAPARGVGYAAFANSAASAPFHQELRREVLDRLGIIEKPVDQPKGAAEPLEFFSGRFARLDVETQVELHGDGLLATITPTSPVLDIYGNHQVTRLRVRPVGEGALGLVDAPDAPPVAYAVGAVDGRAEYLYVGGRLSRRVDAGSTS